ncbi:MAG TPA: MFS transporter [Steroidobacteraceae bacterium]|nr:MFS transporter [Steroidobacteraceae bacterium]
MSGSAASAAAPPRPLYSAYVIAVLLVVYTFNFIDRVGLGILVGPMKAELHLTDTQIGFVGGTALALFYTAFGIPAGRLADRYRRMPIITAALALWSAATAACGLVHGFIALFAARLVVGVGEAGGVAPVYSLLADYFPPRSRARAIGCFSLGIPFGGALGVFLGGYLAHDLGWRAAFLVLGLAGLALAPLLAATVREPPRGRFDGAAASALPPPWRLVLAKLASKPSFWLLAVGAGCSSLMGYGLLFWLPSFYVRSYGLSLPQVGNWLGSLLLAGGGPGIVLGGYLADRLAVRTAAAYALIPGLAFACIAPCYLIGTALPLGVAAYICFLIPAALQLMWLGPVIAAVQLLVPAGMRALASAIFLFVTNLLGLGLGSLVLGYASDQLRARYGAQSLHYAIVGGTGFYVLAAVLLLLAARRLARDFESE